MTSVLTKSSKVRNIAVKFNFRLALSGNLEQKFQINSKTKTCIPLVLRHSFNQLMFAFKLDPGRG